MLKNSQLKNTRSGKSEMVLFEEHEVDSFDFTGCEIVPREMFSSTNYPAVTLKSGKVVFNTRAIKTLDKCSHIKILMRSDNKFMIVMPCEEEEKDTVQWSRVDMQGNVKPRTLSGKNFAALLCNCMKRDFKSTIIRKGTLIEEEGEKLLVFSLTDEKVPKHRFLLFTVDMLN
jgi:hypothetical protein